MANSVKHLAIKVASIWENAVNNVYNFAKGVANPSMPRMMLVGDSWLNFPTLLNGDLSIHLNKYYVLNRRAIAGSKLREYFLSKELDVILRMARSDKSDFVLISGGGNDILGSSISNFVNRNPNGTRPKDFISETMLRESMGDLMVHFETVIGAFAGFKNTKILSHSYLAPYPKRNDGLGQTLDMMGIPEKLWHGIMKECINEFRRQLDELDRKHEDFFHVDLTKKVKNPSSIWHDEIHLKPDALEDAAEVIHSAAQSVA